MHSDLMPETTLQSGDALSPLYSIHPPQEMTMERYYGRLKNLWARVALMAAAFAMSATLLIAVIGAFYSVSSEPMLADLPEARAAVAGCDARGNRVTRQHCVKRLVARAQAQDATASQSVKLAANPRDARQ